MKIQSKQTGSFLVVNLEDVSNQAEILDTLQGCAQGECACSSDEYQKVESMQIAESPHSITLNVQVKPGEVIDPSCISECLVPVADTTESHCCSSKQTACC